jgi:hypothetical protein
LNKHRFDRHFKVELESSSLISIVHYGVVVQAQDEKITLVKEPVAKKAKVDVSAAQGSSTIFIKNLPWSADDAMLTDFFGECGNVTSVRIGEHRSLLHFACLSHKCC